MLLCLRPPLVLCCKPQQLVLWYCAYYQCRSGAQTSRAEHQVLVHCVKEAVSLLLNQLQAVQQQNCSQGHLWCLMQAPALHQAVQHLCGHCCALMSPALPAYLTPQHVRGGPAGHCQVARMLYAHCQPVCLRQEAAAAAQVLDHSHLALLVEGRLQRLAGLALLPHQVRPCLDSSRQQRRGALPRPLQAWLRLPSLALWTPDMLQ